MNIKINKKFLKELAKVPANDREKIERFVFEESKEIDSIASAGVFEKLKGYQIYYRIRFGHYRVGLSYKDDTLTFERVLHRKDIYKYFP